MRYRKYLLRFNGDPEVVAFLRGRIPEYHASLGQARALAQAAKLLFGVDYEILSVICPRPVAERLTPK